jgi:hypothetical protein
VHGKNPATYIFLSRIKKNIMMNKFIVSLLVLQTILCAASLSAQPFEIGFPAKESKPVAFVVTDAATEQVKQKERYGDMFVRAGNVILNRSNRDDYCIQEALLTENLLSIRLFDDKNVIAERKSVRRATNEGIYWTGELKEPASGSLTLYMLNGLLSGTVRFENTLFDITPSADGNVRVVELDLLKDPTPEEDCYHDEEEPEAQEQSFSAPELRASPTTDADGNYMVDILILYPDEVAAQMGDTKEARTAKIQFYIEEANEIFENSEMIVRFRLVHHEINNTISPSATSASNVATSDVKALRDSYGADIVSHWNYNGSSGTGYVWSKEFKAEVTGFNTSRYSEVISRYTFVHECGHNMGARHDRHDYYKEAAGSDNRKKLMEAPGYQFGKCFLTCRTVMAYDNSKYLPGASNVSRSRIKYFSNPNVEYEGTPTGVDGETPVDMDDGGPANNARRINESVPLISACRNQVITGFPDIAEKGRETSCRIYPNPASDYITVSGLPIGESISLTNLCGRKLLQTGIVFTGEKIDVRALPSGMYLLQAGKNRIKVMKQ